MSMQFSESFKSIESWALDQILLKTTPSQAHAEWNQWNVIKIISCIFSPLLITIPLIFHASRKMAEAKAVENAVIGLDAYRRKDWKSAIEYLEHLNDSRLKDIFKSTVEEKFRSNRNFLDQELYERNESQFVSRIAQFGTRIRSEVQETIPHDPHGGTNLFYPTDPAMVIPLSCGNGDDNSTIIFGTLLGFAYLHQAFDELEKQRSADAMKVKACIVISAQYLGRSRGKLNLVSADFANIKNKLIYQRLVS